MMSTSNGGCEHNSVIIQLPKWYLDILQASEKYIQHKNIHGRPHRYKPPPLLNIPVPVYPKQGFRLKVGH